LKKPGLLGWNVAGLGRSFLSFSLGFSFSFSFSEVVEALGIGPSDAFEEVDQTGDGSKDEVKHPNASARSVKNRRNSMPLRRV